MNSRAVLSLALSVSLNVAVLAAAAGLLYSSNAALGAGEAPKAAPAFKLFFDNPVAAQSEAPLEIPRDNSDQAAPAAQNTAASYSSADDSALVQETLRQRLRSLISKRLRYPAAARRRGIEGTVKLFLEISAAGDLVALGLDQSSGYEVLDSAAMDLARGLFPLREIYIPQTTKLTINIRYELN